MASVIAMFRSRTVWVLVLTAVFNGLQSIKPEVSGSTQVVLNCVLMVMGIYFRTNPQAQFGLVNED